MLSRSQRSRTEWEEKCACHVPWPLVGKGGHELVEELLLLGGSDLGHPGAHVQRVVAESLVAGSQIEGEGQRAVWPDTSAGSVERQLADGNAHAVYAQVTETQDTRAVGEDSDVDLVRPVVEDAAEVASVAP